jgi:hypothetical protein
MNARKVAAAWDDRAMERRYGAMVYTFDGIAPRLASAVRLSSDEHRHASKLRLLLERWAAAACAGQDVDVDTLARFCRGEVDETTRARLLALDDDERLPHVAGIAMLPDLRRLVPDAEST